jgi:altronate dehydratase
VFADWATHANVRVPLPVTGLFVTVNCDGAARPTLVTVPPELGEVFVMVMDPAACVMLMPEPFVMVLYSSPDAPLFTPRT